MIIVKLILVGYRRLSLNNIDKLILTPNKPVLLCLGKNGSGKSSLLAELSPLPANIKNEYKENGYKEIHITNNNSTYKLTSGINGTSKHSFIKDGKELNDGGTKKVQLELVMRYFNYTPQLHNVLIGKTNFTTMAINERKYWINEISYIDYSYVLNLYAKAKAKHRDVVGTLRYINNKVLEYKEAMLSAEERDSLKDRLKYINDMQEMLLSNKSVTSHYKETDVYSQIEKLVNIGKTKLDSLYANKDLQSINKEVIKNEIKNNIVIIDELKIKIENVLDIESKLTSNANINSIDALITKVESNIKQIENDIPFKIDIKDIVTVFEYVDSNYSTLMDYAEAIDEYHSDIKDHKINDLENEVDRCSRLEVTINKHLAKYKHDNDHYNSLLNNTDISCVKCGHTWKLGYDKELHNKTIENIKKAESLKKSNDYNLKTNSMLLDKYNKYNNLKDKVRSIFSINENTKIIYTYLNTVLDNSSYNDAIYRVYNELKNWSAVDTLLSEYNDLIKEKEILIKSEELNIKKDIENKVEYENKLHTLIETNTKLKSTISKLDSYNKDYEQFNKIADMIETYLKKYKNHINNKIEDDKNKIINMFIDNNKKEISDIEIKLREALYKEKELESYKEQSKSLIEQERALKAIVDALSHNDGLIAKSVFTFINQMMNEMNNIINDVWSYNLEVKPCNLENDLSLSYRFPVNIDDTNDVKDISETSSSMQEIINLSFRLIMMKYMKMNSFPIFLDEFGKTMDNHHRFKVFGIIETLLEASYEQIFIVSHFESVYSRFNNSDMIVLSEDNLNLGNELTYNEILTIE